MQKGHSNEELKHFQQSVSCSSFRNWIRTTKLCIVFVRLIILFSIDLNLANVSVNRKFISSHLNVETTVHIHNLNAFESTKVSSMLWRNGGTKKNSKQLTETKKKCNSRRREANGFSDKGHVNTVSYQYRIDFRYQTWFKDRLILKKKNANSLFSGI